MDGIKRMTGTQRSLVLLASTIVLLLLCVNGMLIAARGGGAGESIASAQADYPLSVGLDVPTLEVSATAATTATGTITATGTVTGTIPATSTPTQCIIVATLTPTGTISATATLTTTSTPSASATTLITTTVVATEVIGKASSEGGSVNAPKGPPSLDKTTAIVTATVSDEATGTPTAEATATADATASTTPTGTPGTPGTPGTATSTPICIVVTPTPCADPDCSTATPTNTPDPVSTPTPCTGINPNDCDTPTATPSPTPSPTPARIPLRYLAINAGNVSYRYCRDFEYKLCTRDTADRLRNYISTWQPDVIMISEVYRATQLKGMALDRNGNDRGGPILPDGYDGVCGESRNRFTHALADWDASNASHEHECIAWKVSRVSMIPGTAHSEYGRNDTPHYQNLCDYDFTAFGVRLRLANSVSINAVAVHPDSGPSACRVEEIGRYWAYWGSSGIKTIIGGDWNTDDPVELQVPTHRGFGNPPNYSLGQHWNIAYHPNEYTAFYQWPLTDKKLDHSYSNFGLACTNCGHYYGTADLIYGSALGGYDSHPPADGTGGMDHRQILVDMLVQP